MNERTIKSPKCLWDYCALGIEKQQRRQRARLEQRFDEELAKYSSNAVRIFVHSYVLYTFNVLKYLLRFNWLLKDLPFEKYRKTTVSYI